jgi:hypothetical protein
MVTVRQLPQHLQAAEVAAAPGVDRESPLGVARVRGRARGQVLIIQLKGAADYRSAPPGRNSPIFING